MNGVSSSSVQQCPTEKIPKDERYDENTSSDFRKCADVMLVVEGQHELPCHSAILRLHSKVFDTLLTTDSFQEDGKKRTEGVVRMPLLGEDVQEVLLLLAVMYQNLEVKSVSIKDAQSLLKMAHKYDMPRLLVEMKEYLLPALKYTVQQQAQPDPLRNALAALVWLVHCKQYEIEDRVKECEVEIVRHFMELSQKHDSDLAMLSSTSLIRISNSYSSALFHRLQGYQPCDDTTMDRLVMEML